MLTKAIIVVILQYINVSNQYVVYLKWIQCYLLNISISQKLGKKIKSLTGLKSLCDTTKCGFTL